MKRNWKLLEVPEDQIGVLHHATGIPPVLLRIMWNRGLRDPAIIERYFEPRSRSLYSPYLLDGVSAAVERILQAVDREECIRVYGDRDVDGITSTVLLWETIKGFWEKVDYTVPVIEDGYGLNRDYLDTAKRDGVTLIVTVDCGISNIDEVEYARGLGIDVIITDHHEPPAALPKAVAIVNPKMHGTIPVQKDLAGVAVAGKLGLALEIAHAKALEQPLIAFDMEGAEIEVVRFTPREGFTPIRHLNRQALSGANLLFYNPAERAQITEVVPEAGMGGAPSPLYLSELAAQYTPEAVSLGKQDSGLDMNLPGGCRGARRLVIMYLKYLEAIEPRVKAFWQRALDVLTIGTVADMVPMRGENRILAQMGLKFASNTKRKGLLELYTLLGWIRRRVTERDISFGIAPILNSSGRLRSAELAIELLTTTSNDRAKELAQQLFELNIERKRLAEDCYRQVREHLLRQNDVANVRILLVHAPLPNQGVTGIVATRLMLDFCRPVIVLLEDHGKLLGSARSYRSINIMNALHRCAPLLEKYGGHVGAAGLTVLPEKVEELRAGLYRYGAERISDADLQSEWCIDAQIEVDLVTEEFLDDLQRFAPFGIENPAPLFLARNVPFYDVRKVGDSRNHLRFKLKKTSGRAVFGIGFNLGDLLPTDSLTDGCCDLVFTIEPNDYNGVRSAQLVVCDTFFPRPAGEVPHPTGEPPGASDPPDHSAAEAIK